MRIPRPRPTPQLAASCVGYLWDRAYVEWAVRRDGPVDSLAATRIRLATADLAELDALVDGLERWWSRFRVPGTCLTRALARCRTLRRNGHDAQVVLGVRDDGPHRRFHAWVACEGQAIRDTKAPLYTEMTRFPQQEQPGTCRSRETIESFSPNYPTAPACSST